MEKKELSSNYDSQIDVGKRIFMESDQQQLIRKFSLDADEQWIYLTYFSTPCRIDRMDGTVYEYLSDVWQECRSYNTVMTIYDLLCHSKGELAPVLSGSWCVVGTFSPLGSPVSDTFTKKHAALFQDQTEALKEACLRLGGTPEKPIARADVTCRIPVTPFFDVILQFWDGDDEFPPKLTLLWDRNAMNFLHFETTFFLQGDLFHRLGMLMEDRR